MERIIYRKYSYLSCMFQRSNAAGRLMMYARDAGALHARDGVEHSEHINYSIYINMLNVLKSVLA